MVVFQYPQSMYQAGGTLPYDAPTYVRREADDQLVQSLLRGEFCYVFNARQMGKSSLRVQAAKQLTAAGVQCGVIDITAIGTQQIKPEEWYAAMVATLNKRFGLNVNLRQWWSDRAHLPLVSRLGEFIDTVLLEQIVQPIVVFIDEIDGVLGLKFPADDFFAFIRSCYSQRADSEKYRRLTFALFGVATPGDLIADKTRTPFNIGQAIALRGFEWAEAHPLLLGLADHMPHPEAALRRILYWTGGQPFLTQKLCQLAVRFSPTIEMSSLEAEWIDQLVHDRVLHNWEVQDEPEHLKTIRDRLLRNAQQASRLLGMYQQILVGAEADQPIDPVAQLQAIGAGVAVDDSPEQADLQLTGLVDKYQGYLQVKNPIYRAVFDTEWVATQLKLLRPYSQTLEGWLNSASTDSSWLLRGKALQDALAWAEGKSLSNVDYRFLAVSQERDRQEIQQALEAERFKEVETRLVLEQQSAHRQRTLLLGVSVALAGAIALGLIALLQYHRASLRTIEAITAAARGNFDSQQRLDALVLSIKAARRLQALELAWFTPNHLQQQVAQALQQSVQATDEFNRLSGHRGMVMGVQISPDNTLYATASSDWQVRLWQRDGTLLATLPHTATIHSLRFSSDGKYLVTSGLDGNAEVWSTRGTRQAVLKGHTGPVWRVDMSTDRQTIVTGSGDRTVRLWQRDGTPIAILNAHQAPVWGVAFSPTGTHLASSDLTGTIHLWSREGKRLRTLQAGSTPTWNIAFSPDGSLLASASADNLVRLWSVADGQLVNTLKGHSAEVLNVAFSPMGEVLASASADKTVKVWRLDGTLIKTLEGHRSTVRDVAFSPDGQQLISAGTDNTARLWMLNLPFQTVLNGHRGIVWDVAVSPDNQQFVTTGGNELIRWARDGKRLEVWSQPNIRFLRLSISPDGNTLAIAGSNGWLILRSLNGGEPILLREHQANVWAVSFSPDGEWLVTGSDDRTLKLWKRQANGSFAVQQTLQAHMARIWDVDFSPDGSFIASASADGQVKLWQWQHSTRLNTQPAAVLEDHKGEVWGVSISPDSQTIATAGLDDQILLWSRDGVLRRSLTGNGFGLTDVAFSPRGDHLAAASIDSFVKLWTIDGEPLSRLAGHRSGVVRVVFTPDGKQIISTGDDQLGIVWDLEQTMQLDPLAYSCQLVGNFLRTSPEIAPSDRTLCRGIEQDEPSE